MCISHVSFSYFFRSYGTMGLTQLVSMLNFLKMILCDFLFSRCDFNNESVQLRVGSKVCYNAECLEFIATLESSAMLSAELNAVFIDIRSCFYEMACVWKGSKHRLTHDTSVFNTLAIK